MINTNKNSHKGFRYGLICVFLFVTLVIFTKYFYRLMSDFDTIIIGLLTLSSGLISILGLTKSIKGIKEPNTLKKIIGIVLNVGFVSLFLYIIISNVFDISKLFIE